MSGGDVRGGVSKREASEKLSKCFAFTPKADLGPLGHKMGSVLASGGLWSRKLSPSGTGALLILPAGGSDSVAGRQFIPSKSTKRLSKWWSVSLVSRPFRPADQQAVAVAFGKLLRLGLDALLREAASRR